jgi:hypothetical protein
MAVPTDFDQSNTVIEIPPTLSRDECDAINAYVGPSDQDYKFCITCWKLTQKELDEMNRTERVWMVVMGNTMPSSYCHGISLWRKE